MPGVICVSVLIGTIRWLAITILSAPKGRSFDRLLLAPIPLELRMLAKTVGAMAFGIANAFAAVLIGAFVADQAGTAWATLVLAVILIAVSSTSLGLPVAVSVLEVFEAQTFSNLLR